MLKNLPVPSVLQDAHLQFTSQGCWFLKREGGNILLEQGNICTGLAPQVQKLQGARPASHRKGSCYNLSVQCACNRTNKDVCGCHTCLPLKKNTQLQFCKCILNRVHGFFVSPPCLQKTQVQNPMKAWYTKKHTKRCISSYHKKANNLYHISATKFSVQIRHLLSVLYFKYTLTHLNTHSCI